jgi:hypothetical protein
LLVDEVKANGSKGKGSTRRAYMIITKRRVWGESDEK